MKRVLSPLLLLTSLLVLSVLTARFQVEANQSASNVVVDWVNHVVQLRYGGLVVINDTVTLRVMNGQASDLSVGFPYEYQYNLDDAFAYEAVNPSKRLEITRNYGLGSMGFYGVNVRFSQALTSGSSYSFTVVFVFSELISAQLSYLDSQVEKVLFTSRFPLYPSLAKNVSTCDVSILFPAGFDYVGSGLDPKANYTGPVTSGSNQVLTLVKENLSEFTRELSWLRFAKAATDFLVIELDEVRRSVEIERTERISVVDTYRFTNKDGTLPTITLKLPHDAYDVSAWDEFGTLSFDSEEGTVTFRSPILQDVSPTLTLVYSLPWEGYVKRLGWGAFQFSLASMENFNSTIRRATITVSLPEGAEFQPSTDTLTSRNGVQRRVFQQILTFDFENTTSFQNLNIEVTYNYQIFWSSFRPTIWMGTLVVVAAAIALLWRLPKPAVPLPSILIRPEELKSFVEVYEEKRRNTRELESLEVQVRKGRIPRRHYKVRRRTLENRLSVLSRDLTTLREKLWKAGGSYADMMRQIEVAETELQGVEADINRTEARYRRGEISSAAYRKLLEDSYRRRDRAKTTIDGVLLRLREEIR